MNPASVVDLCLSIYMCAACVYDERAIRTLTLAKARIFIIFRIHIDTYTHERVSMLICIVDLVILLFTSSLFLLSPSIVVVRIRVWIAPHLSTDGIK